MNITEFQKISFLQFQKDAIQNGFIHDLEVAYSQIYLPKRATSGSAGYDFYLPFDLELEPGESKIIPTGIRCKMNEELVLQIYPRSSLGFKYRLQLDNTVGIIDSDYYNAINEGHIMVKVTNCTVEEKKVSLSKHTRFAQGLFLQYFKVKDDNVKENRIGGIGSTHANKVSSND
ncbi:MAG: hypothetical protein NC182_01180 [Prevotella sp.]|nr:dUTP diphosphatase [Staphylococcus sp.]MCM1349794.1 hypothetical protein [Prevotella sp.]